jgi:serine/threonine-protein kinase RsbW
LQYREDWERILEPTVTQVRDLTQARRAAEALLNELARQGYGEATVFAIRLAVEEGLNNAIRHGNGSDRSKTVEFAYEVSPDKTVVRITDEGCGFKPQNIPDPTADENLEKPTGRGITLMRAYMDEVVFSERGNEIRMVKWNPEALKPRPEN